MASKTILVIDADTETEQLIASTLESEGYLVFAVPGGDVGAEMAQKVSPSLIFINPGETGLEMCRTIRAFESLQKVPLVLLRSPGAGVDPAEAADCGVADILFVPFTAAEVLEKTAKVLDAKAPIVVRVKEKGPAPEIEEPVFPDFAETPPAKKGPDVGPGVQMMSAHPKFEEESDAEDEYGKEEHSRTIDSYSPRDSSRQRRKKSGLPALVAGVVILIVGVAAGALVYLGLIPGIGAKKSVPPKQQATAVKPKVQTPAPAMSPASAPTPASASSAASAPTAAPSAADQQKKLTADETKAAPVPAASSGKAAPTQPSPAPAAATKKEPSSSAASSAKEKRPGTTVYSVQLGVFRSEDNAAAFTKKFKGKGYDAFTVKGTDKNKGTLYRVLVGKSADRKEAARLAAKIKDEEKIKAVIYAE